MTRQKMKLAFVVDENKRAASMKKKWTALVKKLSELTILCDVKLCVIMYRPKDDEPMVWPSAEAAHDLINNFFALPEFEKQKKSTTLESHMKDKVMKVQEKLWKIQKKNMEAAIDQLMTQLSGSRGINDLSDNEINTLMSFSKDKIMHLRKRLGYVQHLPLCDPPMDRFETQPEELRATTNDVFVTGGGQNDERARNTGEGDKRISNGTARENQSYYLIDRWGFPSPELPNHQIQQQPGMGMASYNQIPDPRSYLPYQGSYHSYQGSSSNGNPYMEMQPIVPNSYLEMHPTGSNPFLEMQPTVPNPNLEMQPIIPNPYLKMQPIVPNPNLEMQPIVPNPYLEMQPTVPNPYLEMQPTVPNPNLEMQPIVPNPYLEMQPIVPNPNSEMQPIVPTPYMEMQPTDPSPNLEMQPIVPIVPPVMSFNGMDGSVSQPSQHHHNINMFNNPIMAMNQPSQYPLDVMSSEEPSNINIGGSQFHWSSNSMTSFPQELPPPPPNEATAGEDNADGTSFDTNRDWLGNNNHHF